MEVISGAWRRIAFSSRFLQGKLQLGALVCSRGFYTQGLLVCGGVTEPHQMSRGDAEFLCPVPVIVGSAWDLVILARYLWACLAYTCKEL